MHCWTVICDCDGKKSFLQSELSTLVLPVIFCKLLIEKVQAVYLVDPFSHLSVDTGVISLSKFWPSVQSMITVNNILITIHNRADNLKQGQIWWLVTSQGAKQCLPRPGCTSVGGLTHLIRVSVHLMSAKQCLPRPGCTSVGGLTLSYTHMCAPDEPLDSGHPFRIMLQGIGIITLINTS